MAELSDTSVSSVTGSEIFSAPLLATHLRTLMFPSMIGMTDVMTCSSVTASASVCRNVSKVAEEDADPASDGRRRSNRSVMWDQLLGRGALWPSGNV